MGPLVNQTVLYYLGLDDTIEAAELPYELTMRSTFDPVADSPGRGEWVTDQSSQVLVEFKIGSMTCHYHYTGSGSTSANVYTPFDTEMRIFMRSDWTICTSGKPDMRRQARLAPVGR